MISYFPLIESGNFGLGIGSPETGTYVLIALQDAGWRPPRSRLAYLADGTLVSDDEAREMARVADLLFNAALDDRILGAITTTYRP